MSTKTGLASAPARQTGGAERGVRQRAGRSQVVATAALGILVLVVLFADAVRYRGFNLLGQPIYPEEVVPLRQMSNGGATMPGETVPNLR